MPYLNILSEEEVETLYELPNFNDEERFQIFQLAENEKSYFDSLKELTAKVNFILQVGYFKTTAQFFKFSLRERFEDASFVIQKYFPESKLPRQTLSRFAQYRNQKQIMSLYDFKLCTSDFQLKMLELAKTLMLRDMSPRFIFNGLLDFYNEYKIVIPG